MSLNSDTVYLEIASDSIGKGPCPARYHPPHTLETLVGSPGCYLSFWHTGYKPEIPMTLSSGSVNKLEWLTEVRQTVYLLYHHFIMKGYKSETARWKMCTGWDLWGGGWETTMLSEGTPLTAPPPGHWPGISPDPVLLGFYGGNIT